MPRSWFAPQKTMRSNTTTKTGLMCLLPLFSLLAVCLVLEFIVRVVFHEELDIKMLEKNVRRTSLGAFTRPSENLNRFYELTPGTAIKWNGVSLDISKNGLYRIPGRPEEVVPENALRIALMGDSTSFGWAVPYRQSYPALVEQSLRNRLGHPVTLRNYSVPGYNSEQELSILKDDIIPWKPDLVILHYDHNDVMPVLTYKPPHYMSPSYGDNVFGSALIKFIARRLRVVRIKRVIKKTGTGAHYRMCGYIYSGGLYDRHLAALSEIALTAFQNNIPVVFILFDIAIKYSDAPLKTEHYRYLHADFRKFLDKNGFLVLDTYLVFQQLMKDNRWQDLSPFWLSETDKHPNQIGHRFLAKVVSEFLADNVDANLNPIFDKSKEHR